MRVAVTDTEPLPERVDRERLTLCEADVAVAVTEAVTDDSVAVTNGVLERVFDIVMVFDALTDFVLAVRLNVFVALDRVTLIEDVPEDRVTVLLVCDADALDTVTLLVAVDADSVALTDPEVAVPLELRVRDVCVAVNG